MRAEHDNDRATARSGGLAQQRSSLEGPAMSASEFEALKGVIFQHVGVSVTPAKIPLPRARLRVPMQNLGVRSFAEYVALIQERPTQDMVGELADAVTTNHTHFWREPVHFDLFERTVVPELAKRARSQGSNVMRVWCAASSSGQEPYTLAALMMQALDADYGRWDAGVLATDISARALAAAERGTYPSRTSPSSRPSCSAACSPAGPAACSRSGPRSRAR